MSYRMSEAKIAVFVVFLLSSVTAVADVFVKKAAVSGRADSPWLLLAAAIFGASTFGWFFVLRRINLATLGAIYSLTTIILLLLSGVLLFNERLAREDFVMIGVSIAALAFFWHRI